MTSDIECVACGSRFSVSTSRRITRGSSGRESPWTRLIKLGPVTDLTLGKILKGGASDIREWWWLNHASEYGTYAASG
jgi:hypothetical protein